MNNVHSELQQKFFDAGLEPPRHIQIDGKIHRFYQPKKSRSPSSWYVFYPFSHGVVGRIGDWCLGISHKISTSCAERLSHAERQVAMTAMREAQTRAEAAREAEQESAALEAAKIWQRGQAAQYTHPYLIMKGLTPHIHKLKPLLRQQHRHLLVPVCNIDGQLKNIQTITFTGQKRFLKGGRTKGYMCWIKGRQKTAIYIAEGWATAASVAVHTGQAAVCAFNAGNLSNVAKIIRLKYPGASITIVADNDSTGISSARNAALATGAGIWHSPTPNEDFNDYAITKGLL
jgi:putative DNA primase/helicase